MYKHKIRLVNTMYGYERDVVYEVEAESREKAIKKVQLIDTYADTYYISREE